MPSIAIVGASSDREKFGNKCVRAYLSRGWTVYPVNPRETSIEGLNTYTSIRDIPTDKLDRVSLYLSPKRLPAILEEVAEREVGELWFNPGTDDEAILADARSKNLPVVVGCSIVDLGISPHDLPK
jgi:predicted CoA-binding protein